MTKKAREMETHHNQKITTGAAKKLSQTQGQSDHKKIVALKLSPIEALALKHLGGIQGLKSLLCPQGLCVGCRKAMATDSSYLAAYCQDCQARYRAP